MLQTNDQFAGPCTLGFCIWNVHFPKFEINQRRACACVYVCVLNFDLDSIIRNHFTK